MTSETPSFDIRYYREKIRIVTVEGHEYYRVFLPKSIKFLGLKEGNYTEVKKIGTGDDQPVYLKAVPVPPSEVDTKKHYKISLHGSRHYLTIPADWDDDFVENPRIQRLAVEVNLWETPNHLRVYKLEEYLNKRKPYLEDQDFRFDEGEPILIPLFALLGSKALETVSNITSKLQSENAHSNQSSEWNSKSVEPSENKGSNR